MSFAKLFILSLYSRSRREPRTVRKAVAKRPRQRSSAFVLESLENRVMLSATPMEVTQAPANAPAAVVTTNHADYAPGETAVITTSNTTGDGLKFSEGELVRFQVTRTDGISDFPGGPASGAPAGNDAWYVTDGVGGFTAHQQFDANGQAIDRDANGMADWIAPDNDLTVNASISTSWHVEDQYLGASLRLMAIGQDSGAVASTAFTDASANTNISVTSSAATSTYGDAVTFTATVTDESGTAAPTGGRVQFFDGATLLGAVDTADSTGAITSTWSFTTASLNAGTYSSIHAFYTGIVDSFNQSISENITQTVNKATATITVTGYSGVYNGAAHTATGTALGLLGDSPQISIMPGEGAVLDVSTNNGITNSSDVNGYRYVNTLFPADQEAQITMTEVPTAASGGSVYTFLRTQNPNTASVNAYYIGYHEAGDHGSWRVGRMINHDGLTTINNDGTLLVAGDKIWASVVGDTVTAYSYHGGVWTTEASYTFTGADVVSGVGYLGLGISGASPEIKLTNFVGGGYTGGTAVGVLGESLSGLDLSGTTHTDAGTYTDTWTFTDVTGNYQNTSGTVSDSIAKAAATITVSGYSVTYDGAAHSATGTAVGVLGESLSGLDLSSTTHTNAGTSTDAWTFTDGAGNYENASGTISTSIAKADATVTTPGDLWLTEETLLGYRVTYDGAAHSATVTAVGVLGESLSGLDLSGTTHTDAGTYTDTWTFTDGTGNYKNASGTISDGIAKAVATITVSPYSVTYDGAAHSATGTAVGVLGESLSGLNLSGTTHTNVGTYSDTWTFTDVTGNYKNATKAILDRIA